ncbi:hypothetical protein LCGC14_0842350 [marine sediment metagenome]|uniref:Uncharacterized protein n=1 Tax=marine sediment metagenome TaxID=412755 RepID=A0A0F9RXF4_9ZZZZ
MILSEAVQLRAVLHTLSTEMQRTKALALRAEELWAEFGEATPATLFTATERTQFVALQARAQLRRDQLDARTVSSP